MVRVCDNILYLPPHTPHIYSPLVFFPYFPHYNICMPFTHPLLFTACSLGCLTFVCCAVDGFFQVHTSRDPSHPYTPYPCPTHPLPCIPFPPLGQTRTFCLGLLPSQGPYPYLLIIVCVACMWVGLDCCTTTPFTLFVEFLPCGYYPLPGIFVHAFVTLGHCVIYLPHWTFPLFGS